VEAAIAEMVSCFKYILPTLEWRRPRLIYDDSIEARGLIPGSAGFISEVNALSNGDIKRQWFIYTRNRALRTQSELSTVCVSSDYDGENGESIKGQIRRDLLQHGSKWLSFGGTKLNMQRRLRIRENGSALISVINASDLNAFQLWWPRYEASEKHRKTGYFRAGGEWVSPMPLDDHTAHEVLMTSVEHCGDRYARHGSEYYRFPKTHPDGEIYHGFLVKRDEIPDSVLKDLEMG
jgi:hypothetical protein